MSNSSKTLERSAALDVDPAREKWQLKTWGNKPIFERIWYLRAWFYVVTSLLASCNGQFLSNNPPVTNQNYKNELSYDSLMKMSNAINDSEYVFNWSFKAANLNSPKILVSAQIRKIEHLYNMHVNVLTAMKSLNTNNYDEDKELFKNRLLKLSWVIARLNAIKDHSEALHDEADTDRALLVIWDIENETKILSLLLINSDFSNVDIMKGKKGILKKLISMNQKAYRSLRYLSKEDWSYFQPILEKNIYNLTIAYSQYRKMIYLKTSPMI